MKLTMKRANTILGIAGILGGILIIVLAFIQELPFVRKGLPGAGFFPILCGIAIVACSLLLFYEDYLKRKKSKYDTSKKDEIEIIDISSVEIKNFIFTTAASIFVILATQFIGLLVSIGITVIGLIKVLGKESWQKSVMVGIGTTVVLYLIFKEFLGVSLPDSMIGF